MRINTEIAQNETTSQEYHPRGDSCDVVTKNKD